MDATGALGESANESPVRNSQVESWDLMRRLREEAGIQLYGQKSQKNLAKAASK